MTSRRSARSTIGTLRVSSTCTTSWTSSTPSASTSSRRSASSTARPTTPARSSASSMRSSPSSNRPLRSPRTPATTTTSLSSASSTTRTRTAPWCWPSSRTSSAILVMRSPRKTPPRCLRSWPTRRMKMVSFPTSPSWTGSAARHKCKIPLEILKDSKEFAKNVSNSSKSEDRKKPPKRRGTQLCRLYEKWNLIIERPVIWRKKHLGLFQDFEKAINLFFNLDFESLKDKRLLCLCSHNQLMYRYNYVHLKTL